MARSHASLSLLVAVAMLASFAAASFDGYWIDNDQRVLSLCTTDGGSRLQGSYQQFGLFQGAISGSSVTGTFYSSIHPALGCVRRSFTWRLQADNRALNGTWYCLDNGDITGRWNAVRQSNINPSRSQCGVLASTGSLAGSWNYGITLNNAASTWDVCIDQVGVEESGYRSSYEFLGRTTGKPGRAYTYGSAFENGRVAVGVWSEATNAFSSDNYAGVNLLGLGEDGQMFEYFWYLPVDDSDIIALSPNSYGVRRVSRSSSNALPSGDQCKRNENYALELSGNASMTTAAWGMLAAVAVVAMAMAL